MVSAAKECKSRKKIAYRPQYSDRINPASSGINGIKEKGYKYPENHVNPVKITR